VLVIFAVCTALMWVIVHSPFGKALQAIRDNETRAEFVGVQVRHYRWVAFVVSGTYTGLAGALWVPLNGLTTPDILHWTFSGEIVFFTVLGGFGTFTGPIVGAIVFNYLKTFAVGYTVYWQMFLGVVLVTLVLALPTGIMGMVGRLLQGRRKAPRVMSLLQTVQLTKYFGDTHAVDHVDFSVREGEVLALIGSNGAGKTTLVNVISGLIEPDSGSIRFLEADVTQASIHEKIAVGIARSFQLVNLFDKLSALDNVALSIFSRQGKTRRLFALADADAQVRSEARGILDQFGLLPKAAVMAGGLSQGERKLLDVAVAYALKPKLLFLDEPTSGVSTREKAPIMDIITHVVRSERITAVIIEHDMDVVFTYCPRIVAMHQGAILADGTPDEIRNNEQVTANMLGTDRHA
jgi:branched-chain amino acid transport system ATP-binding protein